MTTPDDVTDPALDPTPGERPAYDDWPEDGNFILRADAEAALAAERERADQFDRLHQEAVVRGLTAEGLCQQAEARSERYRAALDDVHNRLMTWSIERFKANDHLTSGVLEELARILYDEALTDSPESGTEGAS